MDFSPKLREATGFSTASHGRFLKSFLREDPSIGAPRLNAFADSDREAINGSSPGPVMVTTTPSPRPSGSLWAERAFLVVFVCFCVWIGMLLIVLPWMPSWTQNNLLLHYPGVRDFLAQNFVRGLASGLGVVDIWLGIGEVIHYREN